MNSRACVSAIACLRVRTSVHARLAYVPQQVREQRCVATCLALVASRESNALAKWADASHRGKLAEPSAFADAATVPADGLLKVRRRNCGGRVTCTLFLSVLAMVRMTI